MDRKYFVYKHTTPCGKVYVGMSGLKPNERFYPSSYKKTTLQPFIKKYGWENITHVIIIKDLTKEEAKKYEQDNIDFYGNKGVLINKNKSGNISSDMKMYQKIYRENHKEESKEYREKHKERISILKKNWYINKKEVS